MYKKFITVILIFVFAWALPAYPSSLSIGGLSKTRTSHGYIFKIQYATQEEWTDGLVFKLFCAFSKGAEISFTSSGLNNIRRGWHKIEIRVPKVYRERYGYIRDYRVELYHKGILVAIRSM